MTDQTAERPWSVTVPLHEISETGKHVALEASAEVRAALARPAAVDAVERLGAQFDLTLRGRDGVHVEGRVRASVRQTCVVTLEPVVNEIDEAVDVDFAPPRAAAAKVDAADDDDEAASAASSPEEPEPLIGNAIDLGVLATEFLILGVDPYPRKPGVAFEAPDAGDPAAHPFAALAGWAKKGTVKE
ncbi:MAG TPA: YceD family protein [Xanthobacteraceae bacterium]|nr:YceD family protein [Xanthobacteraceae bacterium]